jgi:hypothetical protein
MTTAFEVRVEGELTEPTLHRLGCPHCVAEAQTLMRIEASAAELNQLLAACSDWGLIIESVVRVSRDRARGPVGRPRLDG